MKTLRLEIFRDSRTPDVPMEHAEAGIDRIRQITKLIEIVRVGELIDVHPQNDVIEAYPSPPVLTDTDLALIMTHRKILSWIDNRSDLLSSGMSYRRTTFQMPFSFGFVSVPREPELAWRPEQTAAHETAHMLDVSGHCLKPSCLMYSIADESRECFCGDHEERIGYGAYRLAREPAVRRVIRRQFF